MKPTCGIYRTIQKMRSGSHCNICYIGGSLTVGIGASNIAATSWRKLFVQHLFERYHPVYQCQPGEIVASFGAMESYGGVTMIDRLVAPLHPDLCFVEFCLNDGGQPDKNLVKKGIEGVIRQLKSLKCTPDVALIGAGCKPNPQSQDRGRVDHSLHREVAAYYGLEFIDVQEYINVKLAERNQEWHEVSIAFQENDPLHLNDYGNRLWFECLAEWFAEQDRRFAMNPSTGPGSALLPAPWHSDEFEHTECVDPARPNKNILLDGRWEKKAKGLVPWYFDNLLVGRPGATMTLTFTGTAVGLFAFVHSNGLKVEATIDGNEVAGPFTYFSIHFGKYFMLAHGLEPGAHVLKLVVAQPWSKTNKLEDPTAEIGFLSIARKPE